jgi:hypothetical protein
MNRPPWTCLTPYMLLHIASFPPGTGIGADAAKPLLSGASRVAWLAQVKWQGCRPQTATLQPVL